VSNFIKIGESEDGATNILKKEKIVNPTQQKDDAAKKAVEEHHAILFMLGMKNDVILKKDPFPKTVAEACYVLSKWRNNYSKYNNGKNESNDGIAFATVTNQKEASKSKKKKGITWFRCNKKGHYSNECTAEELPATSEKKGTNLLINKEDSSDDEMQGDDDDELSNPQNNSTDPDDPDDKNDSDDSLY